MKSIIIIGGGVSGLSAGIFGLLNGYNVTICEKHSILGGNLTGWNRNGYHIDNCIHWLTGTKKGTELYDVWKTEQVPTHGELFYRGYNVKDLESFSCLRMLKKQN